jgi:hypothetical protein
MSEVTPIFVLGIQRSGTTWMANVLAAHPAMAAVQARDHRGVHESIFFSHFAAEYGDISDDERFDRFTRDFAASDYFILSGVSESWFRNRRPRTYPDAFKCLMDEMARRESARYWVEKSPDHTLLSWELAAAFPGAKFVCIVRDPVGIIRSRLWAFGRTPPAYPARLWTLLRACAAVSLYQRHLADFASRCDRAVLARYEDMRADLAATMRSTMEFLGGEYDASMLERRFSPNTSFPKEGDRDRAFGAADRAVIRAAMALLSLVPLGWLRGAERKRRLDRGVVWPSWCWKRRPRPSGSGGSAPHLATNT